MRRKYYIIFVVIISLCFAVLASGCTDSDGDGGNVSTGKYKPLPGQEVVYVASTEELINAIKPSAHIILKSGNYNMSHYLKTIDPNNIEKWNKNHRYVKIEEVTDGTELFIENADKLTIVGGGQTFGETEVVIDPRYAAVFNFKDCSNLNLYNFTAGHTDKGYCTGNVINLFDCTDVTMKCLDLYGCGVYGIGAYDTKNVYVNDSTVRDCAYGPLEIFDCDGDIRFTKCIFTGSEGFSNTDNLDDVKLLFKDCTFGSWETGDFLFRDNITTVNCTWDENVIMYPEYGYDE